MSNTPEFKIRRRFQFCAGHRIVGHESKCAHMHGHNYVCYITVQEISGKLDSLGRVIDFSVLKDLFGTWIDTNWDHGFIASRHDEAVLAFLRTQKMKHFILPENPTAENMARYLKYVVGPALLQSHGLVVTEVVLEETENCSAQL